jgi:hypothetical protein
MVILGIVIGLGRSRVDGPGAMLGAAHVEHLLGDRGFARIDVGNDPDIANRLQFTSHREPIESSSARQDRS